MRKTQHKNQLVASMGVDQAIGHEVLSFLAAQKLPPTPSNYHFGYLAKSDRNGLVAMAIDAMMLDGIPLQQSDVDRIMKADDKPRPAPSKTTDPAQVALRHQALRLADITADATANSGEFERALSAGLSEMSASTPSSRALVEVMLARTRIAESQLRQSSREIDALRQEVEAARGDALSDALTGLLNRRGMTQQLLARSKHDPGMVALCDVDHFKRVNDRFGHGVGDRVLTAVAASLSSSCAPHQVARWGGEEFLILLDGIGSGQAADLLENVRRDLAGRNMKGRENGESIGSVTVSIGAASLQGIESEVAIERADEMLYRAKGRGRNQVLIEAQRLGGSA